MEKTFKPEKIGALIPDTTPSSEVAYAFARAGVKVTAQGVAKWRKGGEPGALFLLLLAAEYGEGEIAKAAKVLLEAFWND